jgi:hypothetical protein
MSAEQNKAKNPNDYGFADVAVASRRKAASECFGAQPGILAKRNCPGSPSILVDA